MGAWALWLAAVFLIIGWIGWAIQRTIAIGRSRIKRLISIEQFRIIDFAKAKGRRTLKT